MGLASLGYSYTDALIGQQYTAVYTRWMNNVHVHLHTHACLTCTVVIYGMSRGFAITTLQKLTNFCVKSGYVMRPITWKRTVELCLDPSLEIELRCNLKLSAYSTHLMQLDIYSRYTSELRVCSNEWCNVTRELAIIACELRSLSLASARVYAARAQ